MQTPMKEIAKNAMVDVSGYPVELVDGKFRTHGDELITRLVQLVADGAGLAVCHGAGALLAAHGMDIHNEQHAALARDYLEAVFREFAGVVDVSRHSPVEIGYDRVAAMDVDGYNKNTSFTPNSDHTQSREFLTTKCVHFDSATPFIGNVYGPNTNIAGGKPIICNTRDFCATAGVDPADLVELMPHSYNVAVKEQYTEAILADYAVALDVDLTDDMAMVVLNNEVAGGLAHAGSTPRLADESQPGKRPLRHIEFQFADGEDLNKWYRHYRLDIPEITMTVPEAGAQEFARYHRGVDSTLPAESPVSAGR